MENIIIDVWGVNLKGANNYKYLSRIEMPALPRKGDRLEFYQAGGYLIQVDIEFICFEFSRNGKQQSIKILGVENTPTL